MIKKEITNIQIRKATRKDLKEVANLFRVETRKKPYSQGWNKKTALEKITELFQKGEVYIVIVEKKIVGFASLISTIGTRGKTAHIEELWLKSEYQGRRIGRRLMNFLEKTCKKKKLKSLSLVSDNRSKAFKFYKKLKYKSNPEYVFMFKRFN